MSKNTRTRILLVAVASLLLVTMAVGGTLAWLQATTDTVENTFTTTNLSAKIEETNAKDDDGDKVFTQEFELVPGKTITKDPKVTVNGNVAAYVFLTVKEENWTVTVDNENVDLRTELIQYSIDTSIWTKLNEGVYYKELTDAEVTAGATLNVLTGNQVVVSGDMTNAEMAAIGTKLPKLTFQAYTIQKDYLVAKDGTTQIGDAPGAWELVKPAN